MGNDRGYVFGGFVMTARKAAIIIAITFFLFPAAIVATGGTFGQRCAAAGLTGIAYERCVYDLSRGIRP